MNANMKLSFFVSKSVVVDECLLCTAEDCIIIGLLLLLLLHRRNNHGDWGRQVPPNFWVEGDQQCIGPPQLFGHNLTDDR